MWPENHEARAVVFILGGDQKPSQAALDTFSRFWATDPKPVIGHRDSTKTDCPGDHLYAWIQAKGYETVTKIRRPNWFGDEVLARLAKHKIRPQTEETEDMWRTLAFIDRASTGIIARLETWARNHVKTAIAAALAAGAGAAQIDYPELIRQIGEILSGA